MKQFGVILAAMLFAISTAFADGTKQFMPNSGSDAVPNGHGPNGDGYTYLTIAAQEGGSGASRPFARYNNNGTSCDTNNRIYIHIKEHSTEMIYFGIGEQTGGSKNLKVRVKAPDGTVVWTERAVPKSDGTGYISDYSNAYWGPNTLASNNPPKVENQRGYTPYVIDPTQNGDYWIEFNNGYDIGSGSNAISIKNFDVTVAKDGVALNGRIWSRAWGLSTEGDNNASYATFYPMSTDKYVSKVYIDGIKPYKFVVSCNSFGAQYTKNCEEDRKSRFQPTDDPYSKMPEYRIFLTQPDPDDWGEAQIPNVPDRLTFAGDAMTCEDLIFVVQLLYNENATLELYLDTDGDNTPDKVIASLLQATVLRDRGFHYPWKAWTELKEAGQGKYYYTPAADGCARLYTLSLFNQSYKYTCPEYTILTGGGESRTATVDTVNPGDSLRKAPTLNTLTGKYEFNDADFTLMEPLGSEKNPILIRNESDLQDLASAISNKGEFHYTIKNFYHYYNNSGMDVYQDREWIFNLGSGINTGGEGLYFYLVAPSETITLGSSWSGIGIVDNPFKGTFRAGKYQPDPTVDKNSTDPEPLASGSHQNTIENNSSNGLFAYCDGATIENIHVKGVIDGDNGGSGEDNGKDPTDNDYFKWGGLAGICDYAENTTFSHCSNACKIEISESSFDQIGVGGILGYGVNCTIDSCSNYAPVTNNSLYEPQSGGIVGYFDGGNIDFCYNIGTIKDPLKAGGIVGTTDLFEGTSTNISNCKNEGYIESAGNAGGIVGYGTSNGEGSSNIFSCYNKGTIYGITASGGIVGYTYGVTKFSYCLNEGNVNGDEDGFYAISFTSNNIFEKCISLTASKEYYNGSGGSNWATTPSPVTLITDSNKESIFSELVSGDSPFNIDEDGLYMSNIECCGRGYRQEDAGRLLKSNTTFYIKWDGKNNEGECVTGDVTVSYQKNSGVTHFPFFDPEKNIDGNGLIVYRISPIQDSLKDAAHGYQELPLNYFGTGDTNPNEHGIELKLYWDDTNIQYDSNRDLSAGKAGIVDGPTPCTDAQQGPEGNKYIFGESITIPGSRTETPVFYFQSTSEASKNCSGGSYQSTCSGYNYKDSRGRSKTTKICCETLKAGGKSNYPGYDIVTTASYTNCFGVSNLGSSDIWDKEPNASKADRIGGYYGSVAGGHMFPISNFGDKNTINTWWNGVEVKQLVPLKLYENEPAILMPVELDKWIATNLEESVLLEWTTASEENNDYFAIERSIDGVTWKVLGNVGGAGTTSATHYYSFEDMKPVSGISYYRLKQVDFNGEYTYSSVKCINRPANADKMYKAYVNQDIDAFIVQGEEIAACNIEVFNNLGVKMTNLSFNPISTDKVVINVGQLPTGTYFIKICNGSKSVVKSW